MSRLMNLARSLAGIGAICAGLIFLGHLFEWNGTVWGQQGNTSKGLEDLRQEALMDQAIQQGEFPLVQELLRQMPDDQADPWRQKLALRQMQSGAVPAAWRSAQQIRGPQVLANTLDNLQQYQQNSWNQQYGNGQATSPGPLGRGGNGFNGYGNSSGGITIGDFQPLMDLIRSTIEPEGWDDATGDGTMQPWLGGVLVDAQGTMRRIQLDPTGDLSTIRRRLTNSRNLSNQLPESDLRSVSLVQLERQARWLAAQGRPLSSELQNLAGLYEIRYLIVSPADNDLFLVGPAGPWHWSSDGRAVNSKTGKPVLQLDDLVVCLRNAFGEQGKFGCSIDPRPDNLQQTQQLLQADLGKQSGWQKKLRETLGLQDISVFGIPADSHAAAVLVEADYRMKLVGMGLEPTIPEIPNYLERVAALPDGSLPPLDIARWWFTLDYDSLVADPDRTVFSFTGTGVKVMSENELLDVQGQRRAMGQSQGPTLGFAQDFTRHFAKIADRYPIYQQLKGVFDLALVSALVKEEKLHQRIDWPMDYFVGQSVQPGSVFPIRRNHVPRQVDSVMNTRVFQTRAGGRNLKHTIVGISGGVQCDFGELIRQQSIRTDAQLQAPVLSVAGDNAGPSNAWWWD